MGNIFLSAWKGVLGVDTSSATLPDFMEFVLDNTPKKQNIAVFSVRREIRGILVRDLLRSRDRERLRRGRRMSCWAE
jgi:hypothetical protein